MIQYGKVFTVEWYIGTKFGGVNYMKRALFSLLFLSFFGLGLSQPNNKEKLANAFYIEGDFEKAADLYGELSSNQPEIYHFYDRYISCLVELKQKEKALKFVQKRNKKGIEHYLYALDEYWLLKETGLERKAEKFWEDIIVSMKPESALIVQGANVLIKRGLTQEAIKWYERGNLVMQDPMYFFTELAQILMRNGEREQAISKYLFLLKNSRIGLEQMTLMLDGSLTDSLDLVILRDLLIKELQQDPDRWDMNALLRWTYIKQKDWNSAFIQTRSLDKRLKQKGEYMVMLGELCLDNQVYDIAKQCFKYVVELDPEGFYALQARSGLLESSYKISENALLNEVEITQIEGDFISYLNEFGISDQTFRALNSLAQLYLYKWSKPEKGVELLEKSLSSHFLSIKNSANLKLLLGDAYLMQNDIWMSEYMYAQVDKEFEEDALGQEAKFRRARLSYFRGDFDWAKTQLDVLKDATSQLISNNAMRLALTITDNLGLDSNYTAMQYYAEAELYFMQNKLDSAAYYLDSIQLQFPGHSLKDEIFFLKGHIFEKRGMFEEAAKMYETLYLSFSEDILADNALYNLGMLYEYKIKDEEKAKEYFRKLIFNYPGSFYVNEARQHYRKLRGDDI